MKRCDVNPFCSLDPAKEARKQLATSRRRQYLEDLAEVLKTPAGQRLITALLHRLRYGQPLGCAQDAVTRNNLALALLRDCGAASPDRQLAILADIFAPEAE